MSYVTMTTATISWHSTLTRAHDISIALSGTEGAAVVYARVRTNLTRLEGERTSLDGPLVDCDRQDQGALGIRRERDVVGAIPIVRYLHWQELGARVLVLEHAVDLQASVTEGNPIGISGVQQKIGLLVKSQLGEPLPLQGAQTGLYHLHGNDAIQRDIALVLRRRSSNFG